MQSPIAAPLTSRQCPTCGGDGKLLDSSHPGNPYALREWDVTCETCQGSGIRYVDDDCVVCAEHNRREHERSDLLAHPEAAVVDDDGAVTCGDCYLHLHLLPVLEFLATAVVAKEAA